MLERRDRSPHIGVMRRTATLLALIPLAACVPPSRPVPSPPPRAIAPPIAPPPPAPLASDWRDWPIAPGDWSYAAASQGGSTARFGAGTVTLACDRAAGRVVLTRTGATGPLTVRTTSVTRALPASGGSASLGIRDPLLDAMAFSRGRFTVESAGLPPLAIPAYAEVARVIEDCRG